MKSNSFVGTTAFVAECLRNSIFDPVGFIVNGNFTLTPNGGKIISRELDDAVRAGVQEYLGVGDVHDKARELVREILTEDKLYSPGKLLALADAIDYWFVDGYYEGLAQVAQDREIYGEEL